MVSFGSKNNIPYIGALYQRNADYSSVFLLFACMPPWGEGAAATRGRVGQANLDHAGCRWGVAPTRCSNYGGAFFRFFASFLPFTAFLGAIFILLLFCPLRL